MEILKENIGWIKDLGTIIFSATAIVVSILTYRRAKATILAPIRTETVRRQSEILSEMLSYVRSQGNNFDEGLDYQGLVAVNLFSLLDGLGFRFRDHDKMRGEIKSRLAGGMITNPQAGEFEVITPFPEKELSEEEKHSLGKARFEAAKKGDIQINLINLTKKHSAFSEKLVGYNNNPFLPAMIQDQIRKIQGEISVNLNNHLRQTLKDFVIEIIKKNPSPQQPVSFNVAGVYNNFNHTRIHHDREYQNLVNSIRNYLRIDDKW